MKIGLAGFMHETHTFLPHKTTFRDFEVQRGSDIVKKHADRNTSMRGFIDICQEAEVEMVPIVMASGGCSGIVEDTVYEQYESEIHDGFKNVAQELDGILLALHGAMVTESLQAPETAIVHQVREVVGDIPIMVALDLHGNLNEQLLDEATAVFGYHSSPHIDSADTGRRAAKALLDCLNKNTKPVTAIQKPSLIIPSVFSATTIPPAKTIMDKVRYWIKQTGVIDVSFFFGFAWSDVKQLGASAVAVTDNDKELAKRIVEDLSELSWSLREDFTGSGNSSIYSVKEGVALAIQEAQIASKPVIILDHSDRLNDTTFVLRELIEQQAENVAHPLLHDPEAALQCLEVGLGNQVDLLVGSKSSEMAGGPIHLTGIVEWVGEKSYVATGPMSQGRQVNLGLTAIVRTKGVWLQITSNRQSLIDTDPITQFGRRPEEFKLIVTKSKTHFRAVYEAVGERIIIVDAPAYSPVDLSIFKYHNVPDGVFPLTKKEVSI